MVFHSTAHWVSPNTWKSPGESLGLYGGCSLLLVFLPFPHQLSLCDNLQTAGTISRWLDVILRVVHILSIFHDESLVVKVLHSKNVLSGVLQYWIMFPVNAPFLLVLSTNGCHKPNEITTLGSRGTELSSAQALVLFYNVVVRRGTSVTYFLNSLNNNWCIYNLIMMDFISNFNKRIVFEWNR